MSNPYEPPRAEPLPAQPVAETDDPELARLRKRLEACDIVIAVVFGAVGVMLVIMIAIAAFHDFVPERHITTGVVAVLLLVVSGFATLGRPVAMYAAALASTGWLAYLTVLLPFELAKEDVVGPELTLLIYGVLATPGFVTALFAVYGIAMDVAMRRRRSELARTRFVAG